MSARSATWLAVAAGLAGAARGQVITTPGITARLDLTWQEDPAFAHNDNGFLEPGEHALILMTASFTGQYSVVSVSPPIGGVSSGTVLGLGTTYLDFVSHSLDSSGQYNGGVTQPPSSSLGPNADDEGTSGYGVRGGWRLGGNAANGQPAPNGFSFTGPGQLPSGSSTVNTTNPIANLERLGWAPSSYADRTTVFTISSAVQGFDIFKLYLDFGGFGGFAAIPPESILLGSTIVPIRSVPAPGGFGALVVSGLAGAWRRRRRR